MQSYLADDFEEINKKMLENQKIKKIHLEHLCAIRNGIPSIKCWCYQAGENGNSLPCPSEFTGK